jgi:type IV secretion system protein TrbI
MNKETNKFSLRTEPKSSIQINKPLMLVLLSILMFVFIWAIINAFSPKAPRIESKATTKAKLQPIVSDVVQKLPKSYSDTQNIAKYLRSKSTMPDAFKQQLLNMQNQQELLRQKIAELTQQHSAYQSRQQMRTLQAKTSSLFFPGAAPRLTRLALRPSSSKPTKTTAQQPGTTAKQSSYMQQNMQQEKQQFLIPSKNKEDIYNKHPLMHPISPYEVQAGTLISAELITAINTTLPGNVVAQVRQNIYDSITGKFLLIPKGSKLIGEYHSMVSYGQERVLIAFTRVIRPDGSSFNIDKYPGADLWGQAGMKGLVNNHWGRILGAATLSTLLSVGTGIASDRFQRYSNDFPTSGQRAMMGAASSISTTGQQLTSRAMNIQPTLIIPTGYEFNIIVKKDLLLEPYAPQNR